MSDSSPGTSSDSVDASADDPARMPSGAGDRAPEYLAGETGEVPGPWEGSGGYAPEQLAAAREDWSDFPSPRSRPAGSPGGPSLGTGEIALPRPPRRRDAAPAAATPEDPGAHSLLDPVDADTPEEAAEEPVEEPAEEGAEESAAQPAGEESAAGGSDGDASDDDADRAPETAAIPIPTLEQRSWHARIRDLERRLLGAERTLTYRQMAREMGVSTHSARKLWRALGFPNLDDDVKAFTHTDVEALATMIDLVREGHLNEETAISLTRSIGQMTDRMVVWQIEALVEDKIANEQLSDATARSQVVETLPELIEPIQRLMGYAWRRQLSAALQRLTVRVESGLAATARGRDGSEDDSPLPLARAVGFADLVSYTSLSRTMSERTLAQTVQRFESKCAEIISIGGGRLVKTVGDEVLYNAETPEAGAEIALALAETIAADDVLPQARVSVVWGRVLSRMGDIYGPTVNLAARLTALADPGTVLVDSVTARALEPDDDYLMVPQPPRMVRGFGEVTPHMLLRSGGTGIVLDGG
ncbi:adenylate/guanylate cyclase domain-containing protein [Nesterenkonia halobia]|uniref:Guanylate cyclase domain-containing protein n=1 Tax=Nesterenkonia halobia TaxID=37922 RepID=A0ABP6RE40_9MICC